MAGVEAPLGILFDLSMKPLASVEVGVVPEDAVPAPLPEIPLVVVVGEDLAEEEEAVAAVFSLTMFLQDTSFNSNAPTLRSRSPTMFRADNLADGVRFPFGITGEDLADGGGVSMKCFDSRSAANLLLSASSLLLLLFSPILLSLSGMSRDDESRDDRLGCLGARTRSSDFKSLVSSFIRWTTAFRDSFSSNSDSRKAFLSMAAFMRDSKSSREANKFLA